MADSGLVLPEQVSDLEQVWLAFRDVIDQMGPLVRAEIIPGITVGVTETQHAHELKSVPKTVWHSPSATAVIKVTRTDEKYVYLQASGTATIDLLVVP